MEPSELEYDAGEWNSGSDGEIEVVIVKSNEKELVYA